VFRFANGLRAVAVLTAFGSAAPLAHAQTAPPDRAPATTIRVLEIGPATLPRGLAAQLEIAATAGLVAAGANIVTGTAATPPSACAGTACREATTATDGANTLLRGSCQVEGSTYRVHLELLDAASGGVLVAREDVCEICTEKDVAEATNLAASALKTTLDHTPRTPAARATPVPAPPPLHLDARDGNSDGRHGGRQFLRRALPWAAVGVGAFGIGAGIYFLALNGQQKGCFTPGTCLYHYHTAVQGSIWLGAGAVVAATGLVFLLRPAHDTAGEPAKSSTASFSPRPLGVALTPGGLAAWGSF
jgi:hypothetical protein